MSNEKQQDESVDFDAEFEKTISSIGWNVIKERFEKRILELTNLEEIQTDQDATHIKSELIGMKKARETVRLLISEIEGKVDYLKKKKTNYG